jgi:hypothetical protein
VTDGVELFRIGNSLDGRNQSVDAPLGRCGS